MPTRVECVCCREIVQICNKVSLYKVECIISHTGFQNVCLDPWVLETAYFAYRQHYGSNEVKGDLNE